MTRRRFLQASAAGLAATLSPSVLNARTAFGAAPKRLGLTIASYSLRNRIKEPVGPVKPFENAIDLMRHVAGLGGGCVQASIRGWETAFAGEVREVREELGLVLEGSLWLPKDEAEVDAFETAVRAAKEAGAQVVRTVCLLGRRYENFKTTESWQAFVDQSWKSLTLAEPVMRRHGMVLAVENHKDWHTEELIRLMERLDSEAVGVCLDTGNNVALLEHPMDTVKELAPFTRSIHIKDMGVEEYEDGFLLSEVPLGEGFLDLPRIIEICNAANPDVQFNLEMITRDPLQIPVFNPEYWTTFGELPARDLADLLGRARRRSPDSPLPRISHLDPVDQLLAEEENNRASFVYARDVLGL